jgi:TRAP-type transport system periplasmic protein
MQWFTRVKYITELPINYTLGALLVDKRTFDKLTAEHQEILLRIADEELTQLTEKTRRENEEAMQVMLANGLQLVSPLPPDVETFKQLVADSVPELVGKSFSREAYDLVQMHLNAFRQERSQGE